MKKLLQRLGIIMFAALSTHTAPVAMAAANLYDIKFLTMDGEERTLADYKGKALLIVNGASRCGYTPQYGSLQALYGEYKKKGLEILVFPANNFMNQEPGTDAQIKSFCSIQYKTKFPIFSKISVKGADIHPLFQYLTSQEGVSGEIRWNFTKFLVSPDGQVVARYEPQTDPNTDAVKKKIESILPAPTSA